VAVWTWLSAWWNDQTCADPKLLASVRLLVGQNELGTCCHLHTSSGRLIHGSAETPYMFVTGCECDRRGCCAAGAETPSEQLGRRGNTIQQNRPNRCRNSNIYGTLPFRVLIVFSNAASLYGMNNYPGPCNEIDARQEKAHCHQFGTAKSEVSTAAKHPSPSTTSRNKMPTMSKPTR